MQLGMYTAQNLYYYIFKNYPILELGCKIDDKVEFNSGKQIAGIISQVKNHSVYVPKIANRVKIIQTDKCSHFCK